MAHRSWKAQDTPGAMQCGCRNGARVWAWDYAFIGVELRGLGFPGFTFFDGFKSKEQ